MIKRIIVDPPYSRCEMLIVIALALIVILFMEILGLQAVIRESYEQQHVELRHPCMDGITVRRYTHECDRFARSIIAAADAAEIEFKH